MVKPRAAVGRRLAALLPAGRVCLAHHLPLLELAQKMKTCAAYIGHDSGITHLAAALGLPGLVLWGPSSATLWRPRGDRMRLLSQAALTTDQIENELRQILALKVAVRTFALPSEMAHEKVNPKSSPKPTNFTGPGSATVSVAVVGVSPTTCFQSYTIPIEAFRCRANIRRGFG